MVQDGDDDGKGLVEMVMDLLGIDPNSIGEDDNLAGMGIDSMQVPALLFKFHSYSERHRLRAPRTSSLKEG